MKKIYSILLVLCIGLAGCGGKTEENYELEETSEIKIDVESTVSEADCFLCGRAEESLMSYYSKKESIGIVHLNGLQISETKVRDFDDDGNELFEQKGLSTTINSFGDGCGSISISGNPNRGYTNIDVSVTDKDEVDFDIVKEKLCQKCLDKIVDFYEDAANYGETENMGCTGYCLIDFQTKELYRLSEPYRGYTMGDYCVRYDINKEGGSSDRHKIDLFIAYLPERTPEM